MEFCCEETNEHNYAWFDPGAPHGRGVCESCAEKAIQQGREPYALDGAAMLFPAEGFACWRQDQHGHLDFVCANCSTQLGPMEIWRKEESAVGFICVSCIQQSSFGYCLLCCELHPINKHKTSLCSVIPQATGGLVVKTILGMIRARITEYDQNLAALYSIRGDARSGAQGPAEFHVLSTRDIGQRPSVLTPEVERYYRSADLRDGPRDYPPAPLGLREPQDAQVKELVERAEHWECVESELQAMIDGYAPALHDPTFLSRIKQMLVELAASHTTISEELVCSSRNGKKIKSRPCRLVSRVGAMPPFFGLPEARVRQQAVFVQEGGLLTPFVLSKRSMLIHAKSFCKFYRFGPDFPTIVDSAEFKGTCSKFAVARATIYELETGSLVRVTAMAQTIAKQGALVLFRSDREHYEKIQFRNVEKLRVRAIAGDKFLVFAKKAGAAGYMAKVVTASGVVLPWHDKLEPKFLAIDWFPQVDLPYARKKDGLYALERSTEQFYNCPKASRTNPGLILGRGQPEIGTLRWQSIQLCTSLSGAEWAEVPIANLEWQVPPLRTTRCNKRFDYWGGSVAAADCTSSAAQLVRWFSVS